MKNIFSFPFQLVAALALGAVMAEPEANAEADAAPYYYGGYYGHPYAYGLGYGYPHYGYGYRYFGKRSADAEPEAKAEVAIPYAYGYTHPYAYGYRYAAPYAYHLIGKRSLMLTPMPAHTTVTATASIPDTMAVSTAVTVATTTDKKLRLLKCYFFKPELVF